MLVRWKCLPSSPRRTPRSASHAMKRNLLLLLLLFVSGVLVQTAAAAAPVAEAEALENEEEHDADEDEVAEAREEFESIDKNGDGFLERDEIMAMEEVRT